MPINPKSIVDLLHIPFGILDPVLLAFLRALAQPVIS